METTNADDAGNLGRLVVAAVAVVVTVEDASA